jgi:hypothetical protein
MQLFVPWGLDGMLPRHVQHSSYFVIDPESLTTEFQTQGFS